MKVFFILFLAALFAACNPTETKQPKHFTHTAALLVGDEIHIPKNWRLDSFELVERKNDLKLNMVKSPLVFNYELVDGKIFIPLTAGTWQVETAEGKIINFYVY